MVAGQASGGRAKAAYGIIADKASQNTGRDFRNWHEPASARFGREGGKRTKRGANPSRKTGKRQRRSHKANDYPGRIRLRP